MDKIINIINVGKKSDLGEDKFLNAINDLHSYIDSLNLTFEQADKLLNKTIKYATEAVKVAVFFDEESGEVQYLRED